MPRPSGLAKTGGRKLGTPNKSTKDLSALMDESGFNPYKRLIELLPTLDPAQQAKVCLDLMNFIYPRRRASDDIQVASEVMQPQHLKQYENMTSEQRRERIKTLYKVLEETNDEVNSLSGVTDS